MIWRALRLGILFAFSEEATDRADFLGLFFFRFRFNGRDRLFRFWVRHLRALLGLRLFRFFLLIRQATANPTGQRFAFLVSFGGLARAYTGNGRFRLLHGLLQTATPLGELLLLFLHRLKPVHTRSPRILNATPAGENQVPAMLEKSSRMQINQHDQGNEKQSDAKYPGAHRA